ncbi:hypothetical protein KY337_00265 [Candidatus Woesearchaeota archaeon]|nr:hypothetical protein [Candidatus Woesearchaeota archaeon]
MINMYNKAKNMYDTMFGSSGLLPNYNAKEEVRKSYMLPDSYMQDSKVKNSYCCSK